MARGLVSNLKGKCNGKYKSNGYQGRGNGRSECKKQRQPRGLPLLRCWVKNLCGGGLTFAEAGLAAAFGFEDLLGFASAAGVYAGER